MPTSSTSLAQIDLTELDFDQIKANIKSYFKDADSPFKDWNYEGSGLNQILDILAHNTHYNAMLAHLGVNESFLDSAQMRGNVVSIAKMLGYVPSSAIAPFAIVDLSFYANVTDSDSGILELPRGTKFKTVLDGATYIFVTESYHVATAAGGLFEFNDVKLVQGSLRRKRVSVNSFNTTSQKFILDDEAADITTLKVRVRPNLLTDSSETYARFSTFSSITGESPIYFITENSFGKWEITFGDNIFGKAPSPLSVIELEYISTDGVNTNGASVFDYIDSLPYNVIGTPRVTTTSVSSGGATRESIDSIKFNAPLSFIAQNRAVTADDYKAIIRQDFGGVDVISVWGGENNVPPQYGKVFISVKPNGAELLSSGQKEAITTILEAKKVLGLTPTLVDPDYTYLFFDVFFKYNSNKTTSTAGSLESTVRSAITNFNDTNLKKFDGIFRYSQFLKSIDSANAAILNSYARVILYKKLTIAASNPVSVEISFGCPIDGPIDSSRSLISSSAWVYNGVDRYLGDDIKPGSQTIRNVYVYEIGANNTRVKVIPSAGTLDISTGVLNLLPLRADSSTDIKIEAVPASDDIAPRRNQLLSIDISKTNVRGEIDSIVVSGSNSGVEYTTPSRDR